MINDQFTHPSASLPCILLWAVISCGVGNADAAADPELSPMQTVTDATEKVLIVLQEKGDLVKTDKEGFYRSINEVFNPYVDFDRLIRGVMATYYRRASPQQRERFAEIFKWTLIRTYSTTLLLADLDSIRLTSGPNRKNGQASKKRTRDSVFMSVRSKKGADFKIQYSLSLGKDQRWRLVNLIVNGINLGLIYRRQFAQAMQRGKYRGDLDAVIENWIEEPIEGLTD